MKLTKVQLQQISAFIGKRGFTYYDVQLEIIDHVACKVEELMTVDSTLTLDAAIQMTHAKFGVMGFSVVEDAMRSSLQKRYWKLFCSNFASYLNWKFLPLIGGFIYLIYLINIAVNIPAFMFNFAWVAVFVMVLAWFIVARKTQKRHKQMLVAQMGGTAAIVINLPLQIYVNTGTFINHGMSFSPGVSGVIVGVFLVSMIISGAALWRMQKIAQAKCLELEEQYQLTIGN